MDGPPRDDSTGDSTSAGDGTAEPTPAADRDSRRRSGRRDPDNRTDASPRDGGGAVGTPYGSDVDGPGRSEFEDPVGDLLPRAGVDSRWWYWIAAIPLYVVLGGVLAVLFVGALLFGLFLTGGLVTIAGAFVVVPVLGLLGLVLSVMYPIATYVDARAVAESDAPWTPDPLVWGLAALATEVLSAFVLSVALALYYLYKRHVAVGTP
jgi:hypothetical protein